MIPGVGAKFSQLNVDESVFKRSISMINSMTRWERQHPELIEMSRRRRIAMGSGTTPHDVQQLIKQFLMMKKVMGKMGDIQQMAGKLPDDGELTPEALANPQGFMPNPNRLFANRADKDALKRLRQERKKKKQQAKKSRR